MGFFADKKRTDKGPSVELLRTLECRACPLNKITINKNSHMEASGSDKPLIYVIGEAPSKQDDIQNDHLTGKGGKLLRARIPKQYRDRVRYNNCARTHPLKNEPINKLILDCCRPSVERDIIATKPKVIFGLGPIPLTWASGQTGIMNWRGRRLPVNIGGHECWFYPMTDPTFLLKQRRHWAQEKGPEVIGSELERAFTFDLRRAFDEIEHLPEPVVHDRKVAEYGVEIYPGGFGQLEKVLKSLDWAIKQKAAGYDYETKKYRPYDPNSKILTVGIGTDEISFSFALYHRENKWTPKERKIIKKKLREFLLAPVRKVVHNLAFELEWTGHKFGLEYITEDWDCTLMQACTLDERTGRSDNGKKKKNKDGGPLSLNFLCKQHFGLDLKALSPLDRRDLDAEPLDKVLRYNAMDAKYHFLLGRAQDVRLSFENLNKQYKRGLRRIATTTLTQLRGLPVDRDETMRLHHKYVKGIKKAKAKIASLPAIHKFEKKHQHEFNPDSPDDVIDIFQNQLKFKEGWSVEVDKYGNEEKKYSTDKYVLAKIDHPLAPLILQVRNLSKKRSTYLYYTHEDAAEDPQNRHAVVWDDGNIHAQINPGFFTETFRLSIEDPSLQNIPKRTEGNQEIRLQIKAPPKHKIVAIDYGQIEHRVIAMASEDKATIKALWNDYDVHGAWAKRIAGAYPKRIGGKEGLKDAKIMKNFRTDVKNQWTFPLFFGAALESAARYLKIPVDEITRPYKEFKYEFRGVFTWQEQLLQAYYNTGYVKNLFGRRRRAPLLYNEVINSPIQSTACELVMDAMTRLSRKARNTFDWYWHPHLQVHDELIFFLPDNKLDYYLGGIIPDMLKMDYKFVNVPILVEVSMGDNLMPRHKELNPTGMKEIFKAQSNTWKGVPNYEY